MNVLVIVHGYLPQLAAGSERMLQHMLAPLVERGHYVELWAINDSDAAPYEMDGVHVRPGRHLEMVQGEPDVIVTHHGPGARYTEFISAKYPRARVVAILHNERFDIPDLMGLDADLFVYNTRWVRDEIEAEYGERDHLVVHPPLRPELHEVEATGDAVTLINLQDNKGIRTFIAAAKVLPRHTFLGVTGTHGNQEFHTLPNLTNLPPQQDMREVWSRTRVLLVPSGYESYGMVAAEACVNGIPVIAHPTPGLLECLDYAGIFVDRALDDVYVKTLRWLLTDENAYWAASERARVRGRELVQQTETELAAWVREVEALGGAA